MIADPFTRASQTWAPARATHSGRSVGFEVTTQHERRNGPRMLVNALVFGLVAWVVFLACVGFVVIAP